MKAPTVAVAFTWRGVVLYPEPAMPGFYRSQRVQLADDLRTADWRVQIAGESWYARLRVGSDRFPGRGATAPEALEDAMREALAVSRFIQQMMYPPAAAAKKPARKGDR